MSSRLLLFALCITLLGCYVRFEDGKISEKYLSKAEHMTGTFYGKIVNQNIRLQLAIDAENRFLVKAYNERNEEVLLYNCDSKVGGLIGADINSKSKTIRSADFEFSGTKCGLSMDGVNLQPINADTIQINLVKRHHETLSCSPGFGDTSSECSTFTVVDEWITGQFFRHN